ncbi:hypothetical protein [Granulicella arctica]|nr:hypothetical protein [Granulicella arctica]
MIDDDRMRYRDTLHKFDIFPKPFTAADLIAKVNQVLNTPL